MKKTLLIAAAALAAGVISSQAQVYSQNVVGYVNVPVPSGYSLIANPLSSGVSNGVTEALSPSQIPVGATILIYNLATGNYDQSQYAPGYNTAATVFIDPNSGNDVPVPLIPPGRGFFIQNPGSSNTVTFTGTVITNTVGLPSGYALVSSTLPIAGDITNAPINLNLVVGATILIYNPTTGAYVQSQYAPGYNTAATVFIDPNSGNDVITPAIGVAQGFFYQNPSTGVTWTQPMPF